MKAKLRLLWYLILNFPSGIFRKLHKNKIRVLAYHEIPNLNIFEQQLKWLQSNFTIVDLTTFEHCIAGQQKFPKNSLLITFDDGDYSMLAGSEILKKYQIPAVVFVVTELIDSHKPFWWREVRTYLGETKGKEQVAALKKISNKDRIAYLKNLRSNQPTLFQEKQLTTQDLKTLERNGVRVANHSHTHPMLNQASNEELLKEMTQTKAFFNEKAIKGYPYMAYPNGNFDEAVEKIMVASKVKLGFLFDHQWNDAKLIHPLRISRIRTNTYDVLSEFKVKVSGLHSKIMN